jgi:hypothetical protein
MGVIIPHPKRRTGRAYANRDSGPVSDELGGSRARVAPLLYGPWDDRFMVVPPDGTVRLTDFLVDPQNKD